LATAAAKGLEATVRLLIDAGADINKAAENGGITPLAVASHYNHDAMARMLRDAGARLRAGTVI
jgi:ankyrin repeat protein